MPGIFMGPTHVLSFEVHYYVNFRETVGERKEHRLSRRNFVRNRDTKYT